VSAIDASRRQFLKLAGLTGGGLVLGVSLTGCASDSRPFTPERGALASDAFLQITPDNDIRFYLPRDEMGQGIYMGLATLVAEELDVPPERIDVRLASTSLTGGSTSMAKMYYPVRQAAANARALLLRAAAQELGMPEAALQVADGKVSHAGGARPLGSFTAAASQMTLDEDAPLKSRADFKYIGSELPRIDALAKSTGTAGFAIDVELPGLRRAVVLRSPVHGGTLKSFAADSAERMPGVEHVLAIDSGVAVVARSFWEARKAAETIEVQWNLPALAAVSSDRIYQDYQDLMAADEDDEAELVGEGRAALNSAARVHRAQYWAPYLSHSPMEPMNAVVRVADGTCEVWAGTQAPQVLHGAAAQATGIAPENVKIYNQFMGGGFGRRTTTGHVVEAAQLAVATGKPIQVIWTREDDLAHGFHRPASLMNLEASISDDGVMDAWYVKRVGANVAPNTMEELLPGMMPGWAAGVSKSLAEMSYKVMDGWFVDPTSVEGFAADYDWPNREVRHATKNHGVRVTFWRSVGHSYSAFAKESMVDELAHLAALDPLQLRLKNTQNNPRLHAVIGRLEEAWRRGPSQPGRALGLAAHQSFGTYVAQLAEVSVENGEIRVHKVTCAVDCGQVVNPVIVRDQMAGAVIFGLTAALYGEVTIKDGAVEQSNFHNYPLMRMNAAPEVEVFIVDSAEDPSGIGEPGLPPIAPAVANAVFAATGERLRALPLRPGVA
jgi:isoquinoline 1-oxidoreductase/isoquinoline 1-oxidoreductase beta subunit